MIKKNYNFQTIIGLGILIFTVISFILLMNCAGTKEQKTREEIRREKQYNEADAYLSEKRADNSIYWGEGISPIDDDLGSVKIEAKKRALDDLAKKIQVVVKSDIEIIVTSTESISKAKHSEKTTEIINNKIHQYTNQILTNVIESKPWLNYPREGDLTYFVYINKSEYEERIRKDLNVKKAMVRSNIQDGDREFEQRHYLAALKNWIDARTNLDNFFGNLPLQDDLNEDGKTEEVTAYINGRLNNFFGNISVSLLNEKFMYDVQGKVNQAPIVYVQYSDISGKKYPVPLFALTTEFVEGQGRISNGVITGEYGQAELNIEHINPINKITKLKIRIDDAIVLGINKYYKSDLPTIEIKLKKKQTVVLATTFYIVDNVMISSDLKNELTSILLNNGFGALNISLSNENLNHSDMQNVRNTNADYLLYIFIKAGAANAVGGYGNMYTSNCIGKIVTYQFPAGNMIITKQLQSHKGFGTSVDNAGWDGYGKIKQSIINATSEIIMRLK